MVVVCGRGVDDFGMTFDRLSFLLSLTGEPQSFYFPDDHPTMPGWFKGMEQILQKCGLLPETCYVHHRHLPDLGDVGMCGFFYKL
jgi:hypothetical protein